MLKLTVGWLSGPVNGQTYVMYHGTTRSNADQILNNGFRQSSDGMLGRGVYLSRDLEKASRYPLRHPEYDRVVITVVVNVGKVKRIDYQKHPLQKTWHDHGYDTAWVPPRCGMVPSGLEENCVWDPARIRIIRTIQPKPLSGPVNGQTYVMYHGTTSSNADQILSSGFRQSSDGMLGQGVYLSRDLEKASRYPIGHPEYDRVVIKVVVNVGKVKRIDYQQHPLQKTWHNHGYDTAWVPPNCGMVPSGLEENCVWDPARIRIIDTIRPKN
uniref:PARP catalytic domain-containing protein n=1 Tax=Salarias fasciatus TaxID=181472 RepID=A0A672FHY9_SALFA